MEASQCGGGRHPPAAKSSAEHSSISTGTLSHAAQSPFGASPNGDDPSFINIPTQPLAQKQASKFGSMLAGAWQQQKQERHVNKSYKKKLTLEDSKTRSPDLCNVGSPRSSPLIPHGKPYGCLSAHAGSWQQQEQTQRQETVKKWVQ